VEQRTSHRNESLVVGSFVLVAILLQFKFMGLAIIGINLGLIISYIVWASHVIDVNRNIKRIKTFYILGIVILGIHIMEEYLTGFQIKFPGLLDYSWSDRQYIIFNSIWLLFFLLNVWGLYRKYRVAYFLVWFFAILAGIANGILHPAISIVQGAYFPGLISSPILLVVGIALLKELVKTQVRE